MNDQSFEETVSRLCDKGGPYDVEAYYFMRDALKYATKKLQRSGSNRHVTGAELSELAREYALQEYGPLTLMMMYEWGVVATSDFGEIVYSLINEGVFGKSETDRKSDFDNVFDFEEAFAKPFEPATSRGIDRKLVKTPVKKTAKKRAPAKPKSKKTPDAKE